MRRAVRDPWRAVTMAAACAAACVVAVPTAVADTSQAPEIASPGAASPWEAVSPYYEITTAGVVWPLGGATSFGDLSGTRLAAPIVGVTMTPDGQGYWMVAADGGIFSFGDARFFGSTGATRLNKPVIGMAATPDGGGYWLYAADGGIFSFGDARFSGSTGAIHLAKPVVGMSPTPDGKGYWLFAADGGIFSYGDARFYGSTGDLAVNAPVVSMTPTPDARGYYMVGSDGGVFAFGDAAFAGSVAEPAGTPGAVSGQSVQRVVAAPHGGYWEITHDGDVHPFGVSSGDQPPVLAFVHTDESVGDRVVDWAMAQQGKPYVYGAVGPASFDCSGLTLGAWGAQGVRIPRTAADQYAAGPAVPLDQLLPGDLVYWGSDPAATSTVDHVAVYIGGGHMVNAPHTGEVVRTGWIGGTGFMPHATRP